MCPWHGASACTCDPPSRRRAVPCGSLSAAFPGALPRQPCNLGTARGPWQPLTPSLALRPGLGGRAGVGAAGTVPTATTAPLPAPPQGFSSTEYPGNSSLFVLCGRQRPPPPGLPSACQAPPPPHSGTAWPDLVPRCPCSAPPSLGPPEPDWAFEPLQRACCGRSCCAGRRMQESCSAPGNYGPGAQRSCAGTSQPKAS